MFYNRETELKELDRLWNLNKSGLIVLYGRRRIGKSSLLKHWGKGKPLFYWTATNTTSSRLLSSFSRQLFGVKNPKEAPPGDFSYPSWESALLDLADYASHRKLLVVFDEFPYATEAEPEFSSLLQKIWDDKFSSSMSHICISGSRIGMIEKHILSSNGPLYGRAHAVIWLDPMPVSVFKRFLPKYSPHQLVEVYSITGGVPLYLEIFDDSVSVLANIKRELLSASSMFKGEPYFLIHEELKEPTRYVAILEALGAGKITQTAMSRATGIGKTHLMPYLHTLEGLKFVRRTVPVTEELRTSRKGVYVISDMFLKFYFRFIAPNLNLIEEGREGKIYDMIAAQFDSFVGKEGFEELCRKWLIEEAKENHLSFDPDIIGKYWDGTVEIDAAAISRKHKSMIIGEVKWTGRKCALSVIEALNIKADHLSRKFGFHINKMIFSKSGFDDKLTERARVENVRLVGFDEVFYGYKKKG